ncbi:MAG: hypothetical protein ABEI52_05550, partial [Halobacteriaceae archaeon]
NAWKGAPGDVISAILGLHPDATASAYTSMKRSRGGPGGTAARPPSKKTCVRGRTPQAEDGPFRLGSAYTQYFSSINHRLSGSRGGMVVEQLNESEYKTKKCGHSPELNSDGVVRPKNKTKNSTQVGVASKAASHHHVGV